MLRPVDGLSCEMKKGASQNFAFKSMKREFESPRLPK